MLAASAVGVFAQTGPGQWVSIGPEGGIVLTLAVDPRVFSLAVLAGSSAVLAGTGAGGFLSTDGGATWTQTVDVIAFALTIDPRTPSIIYAAGGAGPSNQLTGFAQKSIDAGTTFNQYGFSNASLPIFNAIAVDPTTSATVLVGTDAGVYGDQVRGGNGDEWVTNGALATRRVFALAFLPSSSSTLFAGTDAGLYKSTDGGVSWTPVANGLTATGIYALLFDPASASTVHAGTDAGVFESMDNGSSWTPMKVGLTNPVVNAIGRAPGPDGALYAATNGAGVFVFSSEAASRAAVIKVGGHRATRVVQRP